ncbi:SUMF1/EgtB/PvdO family nonheme iron enzyme [Alteromonas facilis]|uniref:SUMF1/EgtB/PvdO family nonheme iron enzyme n=1 Tax=Alteromonas facilis TaxID=2048004 RepID=UPI0013DD6094|nr:SUMF1/EgtB/PvdO family nonheme iron enzyme [Alteromonas facilis]
MQYRAWLLSLLLLSLSSTMTQAQTTNPIVPPMTPIPAGTFIMGTLDGDPATQPQHTVAIEAFQIGRYPVTVAEFRRFAEDTGFNVESTCNDFFDKEGLRGPTHIGNGRWDKHRYSYSDYQPVTCISQATASAYAQWLSSKTGIMFHLPTEQQWEYAARGNTTTRFFWGNDPLENQACEYGNVGDYSGESVNNQIYGYSNLGFIGISQCDDGEAFNSVVGMYRPNPFGLFDIAGNVLEFTRSCYSAEGYKPNTAGKNDDCEFYTVKGGSWHYPAKPLHFRGRVKSAGWNVSADTGFRLVTASLENIEHSSTQQFQRDLIEAQQQRMDTRGQLVKPVKQAVLYSSSSTKLELVWQHSSDVQLTHYDIYRNKYPESHRMGGFFKNNYEKIKRVEVAQNRIAVDADKSITSFLIVAVAEDNESLPSLPVSITQTTKTPLQIPGQFDVNQASYLGNVELRRSPANEKRPERYFLFKTHPVTAQDTVTIRFDVDVETAGHYQFNYAGRSLQSGRFFELWSGNTLLANVDYSAKVDDRKSDRFQVELAQGRQTIELKINRAGFDRWSLTWIAFKAI